MALIKSCDVGNTIKNTGKICDVAMGATTMFIAISQGQTFTAADVLDPVAWLEGLIHADKPTRVYPFFGQNAPIRTITNAAENDVTITLDDGSTVLLRYGYFNRTFETTSGGLGYAKVLQSLNKSGYSLLEIDQDGHMLVHENADGTYSGIVIDFMYSPSPILGDLKTTPYKNRFHTSYNPVELVQNGTILTGADALNSIMGLINAQIVSTAAATTTVLTVGVVTKSTGQDLVAKFGDDLATHADNFVVTNQSDGSVNVVVATRSGNNVLLTGVFVSGQTYVVNGGQASVWYANDVSGFDGSDGAVAITIP